MRAQDQKTREGTASAVRNRRIGVIVGVAVNFLKPMSFLTPTKRSGEKCGLGLQSVRASYVDEIAQYIAINLTTDGPLTVFIDALEGDIAQLKEQGLFVSHYYVLALVDRIGFDSTFESRNSVNNQIVELWIAVVFALCLGLGRDYYARPVREDPSDVEVLIAAGSNTAVCACPVRANRPTHASSRLDARFGTDARDHGRPAHRRGARSLRSLRSLVVVEEDPRATGGVHSCGQREPLALHRGMARLCGHEDVFLIANPASRVPLQLRTIRQSRHRATEPPFLPLLRAWPLLIRQPLVRIPSGLPAVLHANAAPRLSTLSKKR